MIAPAFTAGLAKGFMLIQLGACPMAPPPKVTLNLNAERPQYVESLGVPELTRRFGNSTSYNTFTYTDLKVAGLTDSHIGRRYNIVPAVMREGDEACLGVKEVIVDIYYAAEVYIPAEYPRGSCLYDVTLEHEHGHVKTALATIREFGPRFETEIRRTVDEMGPQGPHVDAKEVLDDEVASITAQIGDTVQAVFAEMIETNQQRQYAIDDPKALEGIWNKCR
jgi:hypothetical protein